MKPSDPIPDPLSTNETLDLDSAKALAENSELSTSSESSTAPGGAKSSDPLQLIGSRLEHHEIIGLLGQGGMGCVYRARDVSLERDVALKVFSDKEILQSAELVDAFIHEARSQARINHPGIATIHYVGNVRGMPYFAMELVPGADLASQLEDESPPPFATVVDIGLQVTRALREAERNGVIHRDVKPGNIIVSKTGTAKLTDFGLSKTESGGVQITGSQKITGTPAYVSPEQARGERTDHRSDMYSLGATLFHVAYGRPPFAGETPLAVISKHLADPVEFPTSGGSGVPAQFQSLVARLMSKRPEERYSSYDELEAALEDVH
ncbi:MAG: serine/threonine-protein kinase, partial [Planctomycetota bacterium]